MNTVLIPKSSDQVSDTFSNWPIIVSDIQIFWIRWLDIASSAYEFDNDATFDSIVLNVIMTLQEVEIFRKNISNWNMKIIKVLSLEDLSLDTIFSRS